MTEKQNTTLLTAIIRASDSLRRANLLSVIKELHNLGALTDKQYQIDLKQVLHDEGFVLEDE